MVFINKYHLMDFMKEILLTVKRMDSVHIRGQLVRVRIINIGVTGKMTKNMGMGYLFARIMMCMKVSSRMTLRVVQEHIIGPMAIIILGNGKITKRMVLEH